MLQRFTFLAAFTFAACGAQIEGTIESDGAHEDTPSLENAPGQDAHPHAQPEETTTPEEGLAEETSIDELVAERLGAAENPTAARFEQWLLKHARVTDGPAQDLYFAYYDTETQEARFVSTHATAQALRFLLRRGRVTAAYATGEALLRWQADQDHPHADVLEGAFPSEILLDGDDARPNYLYDSNDSLAVIDALLDLYEATADSRFIESATRSADWLNTVMSHGERYGVWAEEHGVPMKSVDENGNFDNRIAVGRLLYWIPTLKRLAWVNNATAYLDLANSIRDFASHGQAESGAYHDHYNPGFPAKRFSKRNFHAFSGHDLVVADDSIRAAIGRSYEDHAGAMEFVGWLPIAAQGGVPGYVNVNGKPGTWYHDIVSSGLVRSLYHRLGLELPELTSFVERTQAENGGWYWGWDPDKNEPVDTLQATLTGLWSVMDLTPTVGADSIGAIDM